MFCSLILCRLLRPSVLTPATSRNWSMRAPRCLPRPGWEWLRRGRSSGGGTTHHGGGPPHHPDSQERLPIFTLSQSHSQDVIVAKVVHFSNFCIECRNTGEGRGKGREACLPRTLGLCKSSSPPVSTRYRFAIVTSSIYFKRVKIFKGMNEQLLFIVACFPVYYPVNCGLWGMGGLGRGGPPNICLCHTPMFNTYV